jgi:BRCA1-associated RING domain protein 1
LSVQGKFKNILDQITEKEDAEDIQLGGSLDLANNAEAANAEENKQKRKKARVTNSNNLKLANPGKKHAKGPGSNQQCTASSTCIVAKSQQRNNNTKERNTSSRRNKGSINRNINLCSSNEPTRIFAPPEDGLEVEAPENEPSEKSPQKDKSSQRKKSGRKLEITAERIVNAAESKSEQRTKRMRRMLDGSIAQKIRFVSEFENELETPWPHNLIKDCTQLKSLSSVSQKSMGSNSGGKTPNIALGRCQSNVAIDTVPSVKNVSVMNDSVKYMEQSDCSGTVTSHSARSAVSKKCGNKVSKIFCAFCQSGVITEVQTSICQSLFKFQIIPLSTENLICLFFEGVWRDGPLSQWKTSSCRI